MTPGGLTREGWIRLAVVVAFILAFEAACRLGLLPRTIVLPPSEMATSLWHLLGTGEFNADIASTLQDVAIASALSIALGFALGIAIHAILRATLEPLLASYYAIPTFMFYRCSSSCSASATARSSPSRCCADRRHDRLDADRPGPHPRVLRKTAAIYRMGLARRALLIDLPAAAPPLHRHQARLRLHRRIASGFILSGKGILSDRLCLQQFREPQDVRADAARHHRRDHRQYGARQHRPAAAKPAAAVKSR